MATNRFGPSPLSSPVKTKIMAAAVATPTPRATSISFSSLPLCPSIQFQYSKLSHQPLPPSSPPHWLANKTKRDFSWLAVVDEEAVVTGKINGEENVDENDDAEGLKQPARPCELYVCNLPRGCDISELVAIFKPFGTVISVEVSKNPETGVSKGCGYVTMGSIASAKNAISALDASDVGGREMRVRFSVDVSSGRRNPDTLNSGPTKVLIYESPHKVYIGNLAWSTRPEELRNQFSQFGTVVSARLLYDRKAGRSRAYGFLSFSTAAERDAALSLDGSEFKGRVLVVKKGVGKSEL